MSYYLIHVAKSVAIYNKPVILLPLYRSSTICCTVLLTAIFEHNIIMHGP